MSLVKICGVTRVEDAQRAVELGADLVGLNFWPRSPRYLTPEQALPVAEAVRGRAQVVGVFVDPPPGRPEAVAEAVGLDLVQFHGDEEPQRLAPWGRRAIKVFRLSGAPEPEQLAAYPEVWGFLFDVRHPDYGGTGERWEYGTLSGLELPRPFLVAGGIGPDNARQALEASGAAGIDICSGVETAPGIKDGERMQRLFAEVRR
ncbi:MAG: phosphoribosylanthranilate isomerase [Acidobacteriota bacterium]|nr:phosphoribosylanthranilate isomerase [Acidobacteriota bacterium]